MLFPIIVIYNDGKIARVRKIEFEKFIGKFLDENHVRIKHAAKESQILSKIIDYSGNVYEIKPKRTRNSWLAPLSPIFNLVTVDCEVSQGASINVKELLALSKNWKNTYARMFRKFLVNQDPEATFDELLFRASWEHSYVQLSESEWGQKIVE